MSARNAVFVTLLALFLTPILKAGESDEDREFYIRTHRAVYENKTMSPRARALGGSYAALSNGASGIYENPAGLGAQTKQKVISELGILPIREGGREGTVINFHAGGAFNINAAAPHYWPRDKMGNQTAGIIYRHNGISFDRQDALEFDIDGFVAAYGRSFLGGQAFGGVSFGYFVGRYDDNDFTIDRNVSWGELKIGGIFRVTKQIAIGGTILYSRGNIEDDNFDIRDDGDIYRLTTRVGTAVRTSANTLIVGDLEYTALSTEIPDVVHEDHSIWTVSGGVEQIVIPEILTLRGGMYYTRDNFESSHVEVPEVTVENDTDDAVGFTGGVSWFTKDWELGYTLDVSTSGDVGHYFKLQFEW